MLQQQLLASQNAHGMFDVDFFHVHSFQRFRNKKLVVIFIMGILTTLYSLAEVGISLQFSSLVMFADGLHNLSDGLALAIAFWAENKKLQVNGQKCA